MIGAVLRHWLAHPLTRGLALDDPQTTGRRRAVIRAKPLLRRVYDEWYASLATAVPAGAAPVLELGSGGGFIAEWIPAAITSDVLPVPGIRIVADARALPFARASLRGIVMTDVLHHIPDVRRFLREAARVVHPGGVVAMIEPWLSRWSRLVYGRLHHEPCRPDAASWEFASSGPLSDANLALPWMLFVRDRAQFEREFPGWRIARVAPMSGLRYLLSGGVSLRDLVPAATIGAWSRVDRILDRWPSTWAMFALIVLERRAEAGEAGPR